MRTTQRLVMNLEMALSSIVLVAALAACSAATREPPESASRAPDRAPGTVQNDDSPDIRPDVRKDPPMEKQAAAKPTPASEKSAAPGATEVATLGAGCYWCIEAVLEQIDGVISVDSGFTGGKIENPSYEAVCSGTTGHAEVVNVTFDPKKISYDEILGWFWKLHDPTTLNRQGADSGTQYRSAIFWHSEAQRAAAEKSLAAAQADFASRIVTEIAKAGTFYPADKEHQDYYRQNRSQGYCRAVIAPKLKKLGLKQ